MKETEEKKTVELNTLIGAGTKIEGTINSSGSIRIDGEYKGTINSGGNLIVGQKGVADGEFNVKNATIGGKLKGKLIASEKILLESTAHLSGEIISQRLVIEEGAIFIGSSQMSKEPPLKNAQETKKEK